MGALRMKAALMRLALEHKRKSDPFDAERHDRFRLPQDAGPLINNSYYFGGNTLAGESLVTRIAFRNTGSVELFLLLSGRDGRFLTSERQSYPTDASPLRVECVRPGSAWRLDFAGRVRDMAPGGGLLDCSFRVNFEAALPPFSVLHHSDLRPLALAFAREKWDRAFFRALGADTGVAASGRKLPQLHYEQTGRLEGALTLGGEERSVSMTAARDHSFGKRDWSFMNDHVWLLMMTDRGEVVNFSVVNYPHVKRIACGYSNLGGGPNRPLTAWRVTGYDHRGGLGPEVMTLECEFGGGPRLTITARRRHNVATPFDGGSYYFQEGLGDFDISGTPARGSIEYGFNQDESRWDSYTE